MQSFCRTRHHWRPRPRDWSSTKSRSERLRVLPVPAKWGLGTGLDDSSGWLTSVDLRWCSPHVAPVERICPIQWFFQILSWWLQSAAAQRKCHGSGGPEEIGRDVIILKTQGGLLHQQRGCHSDDGSQFGMRIHPIREPKRSKRQCPGDQKSKKTEDP